MANENARKFEELLRSDEDVQAKLRAAVDAFVGDKDDAQAVFEATIGKVAAEMGLPFTFEEGRARAMEGVELTDDELEDVAGGAGCYIIGGGKSTDECWTENYKGIGACAYIGTGFVDF